MSSLNYQGLKIRKMKKLVIGEVGSSFMELKYGQPFPKVGEERNLRNKQGAFIGKVIKVGTPYWTPKMTVMVPMQIKIVAVSELTIKEKARQSSFSVVKD